MSEYPVINSSFEASLLTWNPRLAREFQGWLFYEAMLFHGSHTWWGEGHRREGPHEGVDLSLYRDGRGRCRRLPHGTGVPAILDGGVAHIVRDFLGQSIIIRHDVSDGQGRQLYSFYGHMLPLAECVPGGWFKAGKVVGMIADPQMREKTIPPHLHLSIAWVPDTFPSDRLNWETMATEKEIVFLDPVKTLHLKYEVIPGDKRP